MERSNTHAGKAESYDLGRPEYPAAFCDYLYGKFGLGSHATIADIGAGPGKVAQGFAERGSRVYAAEPDEDMRRIAQERLSHFDSCTVLGNCAEDTGIPAGSVDLIFCGNSYHWFDRARVVPEFKRILKPGMGANVVLATLGGQQAYESPEFREGAFKTKTFEFTLYQDWNTYLNGMLSMSSSPNPGDDRFEEYCQDKKQHFNRHSRNGKLETNFKLTCMIGNVNDLIP